MENLEKNKEEYRCVLILTFGQLVGDMMSSVKKEDVHSILKKYNISNLDVSILSNEDIKKIMKDILYHFPKYKDMDIDKVMNRFGVSKDLLMLNESDWCNKKGRYYEEEI